MDVLSDILVSLKIEGTGIATSILRMPWALETELFATAFCYCVIEGACWFTPKGEAGRWLYSGDSVVMPRGGSFILAGAPGLTPVSMDQAWKASNLPLVGESSLTSPIVFRWGGEGEQTCILALGFIFAGGAHRALLQALPHAFYVDAAYSAGFPWLRSAVDFLGAEEGEAKPGYIALAQHLAGLIFVSLVRAYVLHATEQPRGWLRGLTDKRIAQALTAMHGTPGQAWSVATLAAQAALSRAAFAARFHELIGQTPMAYLTAWRMYLAAERLSRGAVKISQLTEESGYRSERAFRQAFKRHIGQTPRDCKKSARPREDSARKPL